MFNLFSSKKKVKPTEITDANFNELVFNSDKPILLDFYATWCQPCHVMVSLINRLAKEENTDEKAVIGKIDINANPALTKHFEITSVPTLLFIHKNKIFERQGGLIPYPMLKEKLVQFIEDIQEEA